MKKILLCIIVLCAACTAVSILVFSFNSLRRGNLNPFFSVIFSSLICCGCAIAATLAFCKYRTIVNPDEELVRQKIQFEKEKEILKKDIQIEALQKEVGLLKNSQISAIKFTEIAEAALLKANIRQTKCYKTQMTDTQSGIGIKASYFHDEALIVAEHDIDAKFGIDLKKIRVRKIDAETVEISGVEPKFIGTTKNTVTTPVKELRRINMDSEAFIKSIEVKNDSANMQRLDRYADECNELYQRSLENMQEFDFIKDAVKNLAENFLTSIFVPVYKNVRFVDSVDESQPSMEEFISSQLQKLEKEIADTEEARKCIETNR